MFPFEYFPARRNWRSPRPRLWGLLTSTNVGAGCVDGLSSTSMAMVVIALVTPPPLPWSASTVIASPDFTSWSQVTPGLVPVCPPFETISKEAASVPSSVCASASL